jgi:hypothetical protein
MSKSTFSGTMYGHRLRGYDELGPGLTGAYDDDSVNRAGLALWYDREEAEVEAARINADTETMAPVEVVEVVVTVEIGG